jgi:hypothetical protein
MQAKEQLIKQEDMTNPGLMDCLKMVVPIIKVMKSNQVTYTVFTRMESDRILI